MGYVSHIFFMIGAYLIVGAKYWKGDDAINLNPKELFDSLRKKDVMIIESSQIDEFKITIIAGDEYEEGLESEQFDLEQESSDPDKKKAA